MPWTLALGVLIGAAAVVFILLARRISRYFVGLWRVVARLEPRRRGTDVPVRRQSLKSHETPQETASNDDPVHGAK